MDNDYVEQATAAPGEKRFARNREVTDKQQAVLDFIVDYIARVGYPPSLREIATAIDVTSKTTVLHHLDALQKKGKLRADEGVARGIVVLLDGE